MLGNDVYIFFRKKDWSHNNYTIIKKGGMRQNASMEPESKPTKSQKQL